MAIPYSEPALTNAGALADFPGNSNSCKFKQKKKQFQQ